MMFFLFLSITLNCSLSFYLFLFLHPSFVSTLFYYYFHSCLLYSYINSSSRVFVFSLHSHDHPAPYSTYLIFIHCVFSQPIGVVVDLDDEVVPETSEVVPHIGCLEIKVLKGTDGRMYTLEAMRLTPRDANYVKVSLPITLFFSFLSSTVKYTYQKNHQIIKKMYGEVFKTFCRFLC